MKFELNKKLLIILSIILILILFIWSPWITKSYAEYRAVEAFENKYIGRYLLYRHLTWVDRREIDEYLGECKTKLGEKDFEAAWEEGNALSVDEMVDEIASLSN